MDRMMSRMSCREKAEEEIMGFSSEGEHTAACTCISMHPVDGYSSF
jgi:hypothetical protein